MNNVSISVEWRKDGELVGVASIGLKDPTCEDIRRWVNYLAQNSTISGATHEIKVANL